MPYAPPGKPRPICIMGTTASKLDMTHYSPSSKESPKGNTKHILSERYT